MGGGGGGKLPYKSDGGDRRIPVGVQKSKMTSVRGMIVYL